MKKILLSFFLVSMAVTVAVGQQSLGDAARQARTQKKAPATIVIEGEGVPPLHSTPSSDSPSANSAASSTAENKATNPSQPKKSASELEKQKSSEWTAKIEAQKKNIELLQRELDVIQREQRLRAAAFYADAGTQMRDQTKYADDSRKEQEQIDTKKKALDDAQQKLADLQEEARKAGAHVAD